MILNAGQLTCNILVHATVQMLLYPRSFCHLSSSIIIFIPRIIVNLINFFIPFAAASCNKPKSYLRPSAMKSIRSFRWIILLVVISAAALIIYMKSKKLIDVSSPSAVSILQKYEQLYNISNPDSYIFACTPNIPHGFRDEYDFRIIVLTHKRTKSLQTLLESLNGLVIGKDTIVLDIFVDRDQNNHVSNEILQAAINFEWKLGKRKDIFVWEEHTGIIGQWIDSWRPKPGTKEIVLILEDDLSVSPWAYQWLKAAHAHYGDRDDISGYTLQSENILTAIGNKPIRASPNDVTFLYRNFGTWGFSPHPTHWEHFQDWFHVAISNKTFHPYVPNTLMTRWYKTFEKAGTESSMWEMWYIWFMYKNNLYCVFNNIGRYSGKSESYLAENRREPGLHFGGKGGAKAKRLLKYWDEAFVKFENKTKKIDFKGNVE